ncbi:probable sodium/metabolite cotransporter BASS5, chloroplastic isoform X1 [Tanacetum coccineum]
MNAHVSSQLPDPVDLDEPLNYAPISPKILEKKSLVDVLKNANSMFPQVVIASTILALVYPPSFTWFTSRYYAPALGFLMFAVGLNSSEKDFAEAFNRPAPIFAGYVGQFVLKPFLGYVFGTIAMTIFGLPTSLGVGIILTSCVSGAQFSNYATFLTDPKMAPLSIVMTSLSTATAVFVTPLLSLLLIGKRLPVDVKGMISNIVQIVVSPVVFGLLLNRFFPGISSSAIRPFLPPMSTSTFSCSVSYVLGYVCAGIAFKNTLDVKPLQRTLSYETGMQSSLLALALANKFFQDPLVGVPPAISVAVMSLMGVFLIMVWALEESMRVIKCSSFLSQTDERQVVTGDDMARAIVMSSFLGDATNRRYQPTQDSVEIKYEPIFMFSTSSHVTVQKILKMDCVITCKTFDLRY